MNLITKRSTKRQLLQAYALVLLATAFMGTTFAKPSLTSSQVSIATQLTEVQRGSFAGRDYLSLNIGGHMVGPSTCRSNVLHMNTNSVNETPGRQEQIETVALSAMLSSELVMIVVPMDTTQCVDGKPTFTDLYLLPPNL